MVLRIVLGKKDLKEWYRHWGSRRGGKELLGRLYDHEIYARSRRLGVAGRLGSPSNPYVSG